MKNGILFLVFCCLFACKNEPRATTEVMSTKILELEEMTIQKLQKGYQSGDWTVEDVVQAYLERIEKLDKNGPKVNSVIELNPDALSIARQLDENAKAGKNKGQMYGIPVLLKDNIDTHDQMQTTAGSRALLGSKPLQDSWVAKQLRASGAVILGKTNLSEWANFRGNQSSSGWSGVGGQTNNPYVLDANPCGSSAGSGAAVSANFCVVAIGTETNGSIVCPSTTNGIVGIKPTVGLASRAGIVPISFTQDTPGPMARTVWDAAVCLGALTGVDSSDSKTLASEGKTYTDYTQFLKKDQLKGKKVGLFTSYKEKHAGVDSLMQNAIDYLKKEGVEIIEIEEIAATPVYEESFNVMLYEFKNGLNEYFASLGEHAPIKSLAALIEFNKQDSIELMHFGQELLISAEEKGDLSEKAYLNALETICKMMALTAL
jgi:amidase